jgi:hypothetical protein
MYDDIMACRAREASLRAWAVAQHTELVVLHHNANLALELR